MKPTQTSKEPSLLKRLSSKKWYRWVRDLVLLLVVIVGITTWQARNMLSTDGTINIQSQNLVSLDGEVLPLLANNAKPNLIYFFAPWCQICALSIGNLDYLDSESVNIIVIALDFDSQEEVQKFVDDNNVKNTVLLGSEALKQEFRIQGYPSYYLVDDKNYIVSSSFGYSTALGLKLREAFGK